MLKKRKINVSYLKNLLHKINYVFGKHGPKALKNNAFCIEPQIIVITQKIIIIYYIKLLYTHEPCH